MSQPGGTQEGQYMLGQIYVERLTPPNVLHEHPLVFIHGAGQTATVRIPSGLASSGPAEGRLTDSLLELAKHARRP